MAEYQLTDSAFVVIRTADGANIPADAANRDWQEYEAWRVAGGIPDPYVPPEPPPPQPPELIAYQEFYQASGNAGANGRLAWDTGFADPAPATLVQIANQNSQNSDVSSPLRVALQPGNVLRIELKTNAAKYVAHDVVSVESGVGYLSVSVTPRDSASMPFAGNDAVSIGVYLPAPGSDPTGLKLGRTIE